MVSTLLTLFFLFNIFAPSPPPAILSTVTTSSTLSYVPQTVIQGEPLEIIVQNVVASQIKRISLNGKKLGVFTYQNKPTALAAISINQKPGAYKILVELSDGTVLKREAMVGERKKATVAFTIPEKLGGNSTSSQQQLVNTLADENQQLLGLPTSPTALWSKPFIYPLAHITVTDGYGYVRQTGSASIIHAGVDFKAEEGTPVVAMNRGVVRLAKLFRNYGNAIVIDHGLGLMTLYLHLSKIEVREGDVVAEGQEIGLSGQTGYAEQPHLHVSVRINDISIDPLKFMALFK